MHSAGFPQEGLIQLRWSPKKGAESAPGFARPRPWPVERSDEQLGVDLRTQLEDLLSAVWAAEANWRLDDRIDLAVRRWRAVDDRRARARARGGGDG